MFSDKFSLFYKKNFKILRMFVTEKKTQSTRLHAHELNLQAYDVFESYSLSEIINFVFYY
jgi:hypothetical protein